MTKDTTPPATPPAQPVKRRTRGPNKPKADLIQVATDATIGQTAIVKLLRDYAAKMVGQEVADGMVLQVWRDATGGGSWHSVPLGGDATAGVVRFATARK